MNKLGLYVFAIVGMMLLLAACSSDDDKGALPQIYIDQPFYTLAKGSVEVKVKIDKAPDVDVTIPVGFGGTAVEGVDFTVPQAAVTFKAGATEASFVLQRIDENIGDDNKELYVNLQKAPVGFSLGVMNYASVTLLSSNGAIMSFSDSQGKVGFNADFEIQLSTMKGGSHKVKVDTSFPLVVDESSTAVEGEHFEFVGGSVATVKRNKNKGVFSVKMLKKEEGKDKLVIRFSNKDGYAFGSNAVMTILLKGADVFTGTWAFKQITNLDLFESYGVEDMSKAPKGTPADQIIFEGDSYEEYVFTSNITGDLRNYFGNSTRKITFKEEADKNFQELWKNVKVSVLEIPDININFSATYEEKRAALVGFRLVEVDGKEMLECTLDDFAPKQPDFGATIYEFMGSMLDAPFRILFTRVK